MPERCETDDKVATASSAAPAPVGALASGAAAARDEELDVATALAEVARLRRELRAKDATLVEGARAADVATAAVLAAKNLRIRELEQEVKHLDDELEFTAARCAPVAPPPPPPPPPSVQKNTPKKKKRFSLFATSSVAAAVVPAKLNTF